MWSGAASNIGEIHLEFDQPNQDNFLINDEQKIYAVFDGHGDKGHIISKYLKDNLASTFSSSLNSAQTIEDSLKHAFQILDDNICKSAQSESSGSTCVMAYVNSNNLYVAGVGDCSALLVQADPNNRKIDSTTLLTVHKITNPIEQERITNSGAKIAGDYVVCKTDPNKVINMTRAFGDQDMKSAGIISQPDISTTKIPFTNNIKNSNTKSSDSLNNTNNSNNNDSNTPSDTHFDTTTISNHKDTFLVLFSDGLDQVQSSDEIVKKINQLLYEHLKASNGDPLQVNTICSNLLQQLEDLVYDRDGTGFNDDSTVIVVLLSGFCTP